MRVPGIVEIEERDFYFEISPEDYQVEEANIRNNKENKKSINPSGESRCTRALMLRRISTGIREAYSARGSSNNRSTQEEIRIVFDHPPTQQTENNKTESVSPLGSGAAGEFVQGISGKQLNGRRRPHCEPAP